MATTINTFTQQVEILLGPDDSNTELNDVQIQTFVKAAVERFSRDQPDETTEDESGDAGKYYDIANLLGSWVEGFSAIIAIEYPAQAISADAEPTYLENEDFQDDYWQGGTRYLFLPNHAPAATETMRIKYTVPYTWASSPEQTTTPTQDFYAICNLAAGYACQAIATKYSRTSDSTIRADSASHSSRADWFARRAREYIGFYETHLGLDKDQRVQGAGEFVDTDTLPGWPSSRRYLFHGADTR